MTEKFSAAHWKHLKQTAKNAGINWNADGRNCMTVSRVCGKLKHNFVLRHPVSLRRPCAKVLIRVRKCRKSGQRIFVFRRKDGKFWRGCLFRRIIWKMFRCVRIAGIKDTCRTVRYVRTVCANITNANSRGSCLMSFRWPDRHLTIFRSNGTRIVMTLK